MSNKEAQSLRSEMRIIVLSEIDTLPDSQGILGIQGLQPGIEDNRESLRSMLDGYKDLVTGVDDEDGIASVSQESVLGNPAVQEIKLKNQLRLLGALEKQDALDGVSQRSGPANKPEMNPSVLELIREQIVNNIVTLRMASADWTKVRREQISIIGNMGIIVNAVKPPEEVVTKGDMWEALKGESPLDESTALVVIGAVSRLIVSITGNQELRMAYDALINLGMVFPMTVPVLENLIQQNSSISQSNVNKLRKMQKFFASAFLFSVGGQLERLVEAPVVEFVNDVVGSSEVIAQQTSETVQVDGGDQDSAQGDPIQRIDLSDPASGEELASPDESVVVVNDSQEVYSQMRLSASLWDSIHQSTTSWTGEAWQNPVINGEMGVHVTQVDIITDLIGKTLQANGMLPTVDQLGSVGSMANLSEYLASVENSEMFIKLLESIKEASSWNEYVQDVRPEVVQWMNSLGR